MRCNLSKTCTWPYGYVHDYCLYWARGPGFNPHWHQFFFFLFSPFSLIPSQSASLYIIASFEVYLIAENNYPHVLVVLFQKSSTVEYILTPSIFDMSLLYSISSLKSMTDMRGSSNFRLRGGGGGGAGQNLTEEGFVNFLVLKLIYSGFNVLKLFTVGSTVNFKGNCTFLFQRGSNITQGSD